MRRHMLLPLTLLLAGCWTPGPGQVDPTRYPWDQPKPGYCVVSLELPSSSGIVAGGGEAVHMACKEQPRR
jgi:hypothetical protein